MNKRALFWLAYPSTLPPTDHHPSPLLTQLSSKPQLNRMTYITLDIMLDWLVYVHIYLPCKIITSQNADIDFELFNLFYKNEKQNETTNLGFRLRSVTPLTKTAQKVNTVLCSIQVGRSRKTFAQWFFESHSSVRTENVDIYKYTVTWIQATSKHHHYLKKTQLAINDLWLVIYLVYREHYYCTWNSKHINGSNLMLRSLIV